MIVTQQGMEVLGVDLSPSVSIKDRSLYVRKTGMPNT